MTAIQAELSARLGTAPVIMFSMNLMGHTLVPRGVEIVKDEKRDHGQKGAEGRLLLEGKQIKVKHFIDLVRFAGFVPLRLVAVDRHEGKGVRLVLVSIHRDALQPGDTALDPAIEESFRRILEKYNFDLRIYRNPGETGGNFMIEAGNPVRSDRIEFPQELQIDGAQELELGTPRRPRPKGRQERRDANHRQLAREIQRNSPQTRRNRG